jgi:cysteine desulfurase
VATCAYFDHAATTPLDPRVRHAMEPFLGESFGNPSSLHGPGRAAHDALEAARAEVAALIGARPAEIVFTGSGTEADNLAIFGAVGAAQAPVHVVVSAFEHPAVLEPCRALERRGVEVTRLPVTADGLVEPEALAAALRPTTRLVSVMTANNVVGTVQPIAELAALARRAGALFHSDAVQGAGKVPLDVSRLPIDLLSLSAHKLHGPKGVGALYVRDGVELAPLILGGGQERGLRSATENVAAIVGFGQAALLARVGMAEESTRLVALRDHVLEVLSEEIGNLYQIGHPYLRLPGHLCLGFSGQEADAIRLLFALDDAGIAVSSGSACSAHNAGEPSYVLTAMGFDTIRARGSLRLTMGRFTSDDDVDRLLATLPRAAASLTSIASHTGFGMRTRTA